MIRAAVVGVGYLGSFHADKWKKISDDKNNGISLEFIFDQNLEQARLVANKNQCQTVNTARELIGKVDAVTIATSTPSHFELAKMFLENKIHVLVEKPMSLTSSECQSLCHLAEKNGLQLAVGHSERYNPAYIFASAHVQNPIHIEMKRWAPFKERGSDVSVVYDLLIHDLDLYLNLCSSDIKIIYVKSGSFVSKTEDWIQVVLESLNKNQKPFSANISISRINSDMQRSFQIISNDLAVQADLQNVEVKKISAKNKVVEIETLKLDKQDHLYLETYNFVQAINGKEKINVTGRDGLRASIVLDQIFQMLKGK